MTTTTRKALVTTPPRARRPAADTPEPPAVPEGATATLTAVSPDGATYHVYPDQTRSQHVVVIVGADAVPERVTEYPWDAWELAARFVVGVVGEKVRRLLGTPVAYCGDCGAEAKRDATGAAVCPKHGRP